GEDAETHPGGEELQHPMFELEKLSRPVRRFPHRYDTRIADEALERLEVGKTVARFGRGQANRMATHPVDRRLGLLRDERGDREANQGTDEEEPTRMHVGTHGDYVTPAMSAIGDPPRG